MRNSRVVKEVPKIRTYVYKLRNRVSYDICYFSYTTELDQSDIFYLIFFRFIPVTRNRDIRSSTIRKFLFLLLLLNKRFILLCCQTHRIAKSVVANRVSSSLILE